MGAVGDGSVRRTADSRCNDSRDTRREGNKYHHQRRQWRVPVPEHDAGDLECVEADMFGFDHVSRRTSRSRIRLTTKIDIAFQLQSQGCRLRKPRRKVMALRPRTRRWTRRSRRNGANQAPALIAEVPAELAPAVPNSSANDSFNIAGTVSTGLETNNNDFANNRRHRIRRARRTKPIRRVAILVLPAATRAAIPEASARSRWPWWPGW